jgi:hypothetical protein
VRRIFLLAGVLVTAIALAGGVVDVHARQQAPLSPHEVHEFDAGGCHFTFNYGRPSKRGRAIWGGLVSWGHWWMPGADQATILTTTKPVQFDGVLMPAGEHTLYMLPNAEADELVINNQVGQFHTHYEPARDLGHIKFPWRKISPIVEQMTYGVMEIQDVGAQLTLTWDDRQYFATFKVKAPAP